MNPVDLSAAIIVSLSLRPASAGRTFHICHPRPLRLPQLFAWLRGNGYPVEVVPYARWREALLAHCRTHHDNALYPLLPMFAADERAMGTAADFPTFSRANTDTALRRATEAVEVARGLCPAPRSTVPTISDKLLAVCFGYFTRCGFLPPPHSDGESIFAMDV